MKAAYPSKRRPSPPASDPAGVLHRAGLRKTAQRVAVLRRLAGAHAPTSHGEIAKGLAPLGFDRATVYRNLIDLVDAGLATRADWGDHIWRFSLVRDGDAEHTWSHPHFLCTDCGEVSCLPGGAINVVATRGVPRAVRKRKVEVQVKGRCDACAR